MTDKLQKTETLTVWDLVAIERGIEYLIEFDRIPEGCGTTLLQKLKRANKIRLEYRGMCPDANRHTVSHDPR